MDLKTLQTFRRIAATGSFSRAAEEMNYAASTVTMQIQKLESDLGVRLIERGKPFRLTEAGRLFYEQSASIVRNMEQLQVRLTDMKSGEAGTIRLGAAEPTASFRLPALLGRFMDRHPGIRIDVEIANTPVLGEKLLRGELDLAVCTTPGFGTELYFDPLFIERFVLLVPEDHPIASLAKVGINEIRSARLLITAASCPYRRKLESMLTSTGGPSQETMEVGSMTALPHYVAQGLGIALIPQIAAAAAPAGTAVIQLNDGQIDMAIGFLYREDAIPFGQAAARLLQYLGGEWRTAPPAASK